MNRAIYRKQTREDKFERKYWVHNRAKRNLIRFIKRINNKKIRREELK